MIDCRGAGFLMACGSFGFFAGVGLGIGWGVGRIYCFFLVRGEVM